VNAHRRRQFAYLANGKRDLLAWAADNGIPLVRVEFVVPFVDTDHSTYVWLFYDTDVNVANLADSGLTTSIEEQFRSILTNSSYPADWLAAISFTADSHENVERNFEGSYFYRLRSLHHRVNHRVAGKALQSIHDRLAACVTHVPRPICHGRPEIQQVGSVQCPVTGDALHRCPTTCFTRRVVRPLNRVPATTVAR
jgi:hypothetical protein